MGTKYASSLNLCPAGAPGPSPSWLPCWSDWSSYYHFNYSGIAGDSFEMDAVGALRLSPLRRGLAIDSTVDIFTFYVPHRHVYGEQWIKFMKDGVNATPLPTVNTTGYIDHAAFLGTINPDTNKIPKHLFQGYLNIYNNYFKAPWMPDRTEANPNEL